MTGDLLLPGEQKRYQELSSYIDAQAWAGPRFVAKKSFGNFSPGQGSANFFCNMR